VTELMVVLFIFGLVVWFIVKEPSRQGEKGLFSRLEDTVGKYVERK